MNEEPKVFPNEQEQQMEQNDLEELEIPEDSEFGYVVAMTKEGNLHFQTFGGPEGLKKTWLLAGLQKAVNVIVNSMVEKQINVSNAALLTNMLGSQKQLVGIMKMLASPAQKNQPEANNTTVTKE